MYDTRYAPTLELSATINHSIDELKVIAFKGRDTTYGRKAVVLKGEETPTKQIQEGDYLKNTTAIPERVQSMVEQDGYFLYVLQPLYVRATGPDVFENVEEYTFETEYGTSRRLSPEGVSVAGENSE
jgi:hypothetical protein